ncbi:hypothetical protein Pan258_18800 [Symmachiella dynata]|uniref:SWIM zinc finger family protein n=1 Tax=Symmachiella dynata TaxID=2527995 RepID=UPI00118BDA33|nr:SWIM zinc finger family protein [Symmachiella dynata]QDT47842.1 hypothetical protein Pan258_18800 [Symmachiella dynata]
MAASTLSYTYRYPFASDVAVTPTLSKVRMATSLDGTSADLFFDGRLRRPSVVGKLLTVLCDVVRTRFYQPFEPLLLDPVVTSGGGMLRFEGFSSCCGVYVRVDLPPDTFDVELRGKGTTNVDFNEPMRTALSRLADRDEAEFRIGGQAVTLSTDSATVVERKVQLPMRWIKGFCEVQAYQPRLVPHFDLSPHETRDLLKAFPKSKSKMATFITKSGRAYRPAAREKPGSVRVTGADRVRVLKPLLPTAQAVRVWYDEQSQTSGWDINTDAGRLFLMISPELNRGFSGEGQALERLAVGQWQSSVVDVADSLNWQSNIEPAEISRETNTNERDVEAALALLGARGLVGYDVTAGRYFHRVLPFDLEKVEALQPRLKNARGLVDAVEIVSRDGSDVDATVPGSGVRHYVRLRLAGDRCTCTWFARHQGSRGPCKHVLAARMRIEGVENVKIGRDNLV